MPNKAQSPPKSKLTYEKICGLWRKTRPDGRVYFMGKSVSMNRVFIVEPALVKSPGGPEYEIKMSSEIDDGPPPADQ